MSYFAPRQRKPREVHIESTDTSGLSLGFIRRTERKLYNKLNSLLRGVNEKIQNHQDRLLKAAPTSPANPLFDRIEKLAGDGNYVAAYEALKLMRTVEYEATDFISRKDENVRLCHICGALQCTLGPIARYNSHTEGKQHKGYLKLRQKLASMRLNPKKN